MLRINKLFSGQGSNNDAQCQEKKQKLIDAIIKNTEKINSHSSPPHSPSPHVNPH
jgi:hypothetical protein